MTWKPEQHPANLTYSAVSAPFPVGDCGNTYWVILWLKTQDSPSENYFPAEYFTAMCRGRFTVKDGNRDELVDVWSNYLARLSKQSPYRQFSELGYTVWDDASQKWSGFNTIIPYPEDYVWAPFESFTLTTDKLQTLCGRRDIYGHSARNLIATDSISMNLKPFTSTFMSLDDYKKIPRFAKAILTTADSIGVNACKIPSGEDFYDLLCEDISRWSSKSTSSGYSYWRGQHKYMSARFLYLKSPYMLSRCQGMELPTIAEYPVLYRENLGDAIIRGSNTSNDPLNYVLYTSNGNYFKEFTTLNLHDVPSGGNILRASPSPLLAYDEAGSVEMRKAYIEFMEMSLDKSLPKLYNHSVQGWSMPNYTEKVRHRQILPGLMTILGVLMEATGYRFAPGTAHPFLVGRSAALAFPPAKKITSSVRRSLVDAMFRERIELVKQNRYERLERVTLSPIDKSGTELQRHFEPCTKSLETARHVLGSYATLKDINGINQVTLSEIMDDAPAISRVPIELSDGVLDTIAGFSDDYLTRVGEGSAALDNLYQQHREKLAKKSLACHVSY